MTPAAAPTSPTAGRRAAKKPGSPTDPPQPAAWRSRIVGQGTEDPTQLVANPKNWRIHPKGQQHALGSVLDEVGWVQQVLVNRTTGNVVDGHLRVELAIGRDEPAVPVLYVELSEQEEALVLASLDPLSAMAASDEEQLRELLSEITIEQAGAYDIAGLDSTEAIRRVLEIAVLDALGSENSVARSRTLIAGALAAAKLLEAEQIESFAISIEDDGCHDQAIVDGWVHRSCPSRSAPFAQGCRRCHCTATKGTTSSSGRA